MRVRSTTLLDQLPMTGTPSRLSLRTKARAAQMATRRTLRVENMTHTRSMHTALAPVMIRSPCTHRLLELLQLLHSIKSSLGQRKPRSLRCPKLLKLRAIESCISGSLEVSKAAAPQSTGARSRPTEDLTIRETPLKVHLDGEDFLAVIRNAYRDNTLSSRVLLHLEQHPRYTVKSSIVYCTNAIGDTVVAVPGALSKGRRVTEIAIDPAQTSAQ